MNLNLGAGTDYKEGWVNHDIGNKDIYGNGIKADVIWDLDVYPWPWDDNTFDEIKAWAIIEHLKDGAKPWEEIKRIAKNGCIIHASVPHYSGFIGYGDPTHYHRYSYQTGQIIARMWGFKMLKNRLIFSWGYKFPMLKIFNPIVNIQPEFYERCFANIFPSQELEWTFEVVK